MMLPAMAFRDLRFRAQHALRVAALLSSLVLAAHLPAQAAPPNTPEEPVKARLVPEASTVAPGTTLWVDLHLDITPGWHTYWRNPGDSGLPTEIAWTLPAGFSAGDIVWPVPERFVVNGLGNYGYRDAVDLLIPIAVSQQVKLRETAPLTAAASWLVCSDICIPGEAKLSLALPVATAPSAPDPAVNDLFAAARSHLPKPAAFEARFATAGQQFRLILPEAAFAGIAQPSATFFPIDANAIDAAAEPKLERRDGRFELLLDRASTPAATVPKALDGVLVLRGANRAEQAVSLHATPAAVIPAGENPADIEW
jgi:DsbC/DsbD-like thiol-disulfide interchange protein